MAQAPTFMNKNPSGQFVPAITDGVGTTAAGLGTLTKLNMAAANVVKVGPGRVGSVINNAGTAGFTLNDCATTGAATAANTIMTVTTTTVGQVIRVDMPFTVGLVVSSVGASGVLAVSYS